MHKKSIGLGFSMLLMLTGCGSQKLSVDRAQELCADMQEKAQIIDIVWSGQTRYDKGGWRVTGVGQDRGRPVDVACNVAADELVVSSESGTP